MTAHKPLYLIVSGKDGGSGSFGSPPGDPKLTYSVHGYWGGRIKPVNGPDLIASLDYLVSGEDRDVPAELKARAQRLIDQAAAARTEPSEEWVRHTYGYFAHSYSPDGADRNVSHSVSWHGQTTQDKCSCGKSFDDPKALVGHIAGSRRDLPGRIGQLRHHKVEGEKPLPPGHHLGYLAVKKYYPDHQPRLELIAHPEGLYGTRECSKCHERVQYEACWDKWAVFGKGPDCPQGGGHETVPPEGEPERQAFLAKCCPACEGD